MSERFRSSPSSSKPFGMQGMPLSPSLPTSFVDEQRLKATAAVGNEERGLAATGERRVWKNLTAVGRSSAEHCATTFTCERVGLLLSFLSLLQEKEDLLATEAWPIEKL